MNKLSLFGLGFAALFAVGCGPAHIAPFAPRQRSYTPGDYAKAKTGKILAPFAWATSWW